MSARLRGRVLAVQHGTTVDVYDAQTGAKRQSRELLTDGGPPPILLGVQGDLVVYETGGAIHLLRLSDGRDKALLIPGAAPGSTPASSRAALHQLEQDARPPPGPNRVHPAADDRRPLVGGGERAVSRRR